eukprot:CAMPEP_0172511240 /NCGR_PEP_ID=MMETSP1066-20121228/234896_1 /TAXON_ID=671091 /ORGANISM="Coscinodiscus wailesii, Strain CCMP2513" /LENGTH=385 /DNA_ID=CAMNT_0013290539 /DNA_START=98 /DNA_END=1251 /DNA_ORIENTATION=+
MAIGDTRSTMAERDSAFLEAVRKKPRILVCAPSNAAVDNIILKIMADGFIDGNGCRYNPSLIRVGIGQSTAVRDVALEAKVNSVLEGGMDLAALQKSMAKLQAEKMKICESIAGLRRRVNAIISACKWNLAKHWEIRIEQSFDQTGRVFFVNHKTKSTQFEVPAPPEPGEDHYSATAMPEYRSFMSSIVQLVERFNSVTSKLTRCSLVNTVTNVLAKGGVNAQGQQLFNVKQQLETDILNSVHIVLTTLGTAGSRNFEDCEKFEVVVVDEAAQSVEPASLVALQLGSKHAILVGDPQQLPATIFSVSGRSTKYDRSLFQRLEEAGNKVYMLDTQYRMHPAISDFPRRIFYDGSLLDGDNVKHPEYGCPLRREIQIKFPAFQSFTV